MFSTLLSQRVNRNETYKRAFATCTTSRSDLWRICEMPRFSGQSLAKFLGDNELVWMILSARNRRMKNRSRDWTTMFRLQSSVGAQFFAILYDYMNPFLLWIYLCILRMVCAFRSKIELKARTNYIKELLSVYWSIFWTLPLYTWIEISNCKRLRCVKSAREQYHLLVDVSGWFRYVWLNVVATLAGMPIELRLRSSFTHLLNCEFIMR